MYYYIYIYMFDYDYQDDLKNTMDSNLMKPFSTITWTKKAIGIVISNISTAFKNKLPSDDENSDLLLNKI